MCLHPDLFSQHEDWNGIVVVSDITAGLCLGMGINHLVRINPYGFVFRDAHGDKNEGENIL